MEAHSKKIVYAYLVKFKHLFWWIRHRLYWNHGPILSLNIRGDFTGCIVFCGDDSKEMYNGCILAVHAPDAVKLLGDQATFNERRILGAFQYVYRCILSSPKSIHMGYTSKKKKKKKHIYLAKIHKNYFSFFLIFWGCNIDFLFVLKN